MVKIDFPIFTLFSTFPLQASAGPAVFILAASYAGCNRTLTVAFFIVAMGFMGAYYAGMKVNALDLSPNYAGPLMAITNGKFFEFSVLLDFQNFTLFSIRYCCGHRHCEPLLGWCFNA